MIIAVANTHSTPHSGGFSGPQGNLTVLYDPISGAARAAKRELCELGYLVEVKCNCSVFCGFTHWRLETHVI